MAKFDAKKYLQKESTTSPWLILPFILTLIITPLIMGVYSFDPNLGTEYWHINSANFNDIFLYYKSVFLSIAGGLLALIVVVYRFTVRRKFSFGIALIPIYVYIGCIIFSTIFSTSREHSLHGIQHQFEPTFALLAYCILVIYAVYFIDNERTLKWFINGFLIGTAILAILGLMQYLSGLTGIKKLEPFNTKWMAEYIYLFLKLTNPRARTGSLSLNFPPGQVYITLYNPNYIAYFTILTAPFFTVMAFCREKIWQKIVCALVAVTSIVCLIGSQSVAGFLSVFVSAFVIIVAFRKKIFKHWRILLISFGAFLAAIIVLDLSSSHAVLNRLKYVTSKLNISAKTGYQNEDTIGLRGLTSSPDGIKIEYKDAVAFFSMDYDEQKGITCKFKDENGAALDTKTTTDSDGSKIISLTDKRFEDNVSVSFAEYLTNTFFLPVSMINIDGKTWIVTNQIHTISYSYAPSGNTAKTPFMVMHKAEQEKIGTYYYYTYSSKMSVQNLFQSFINNPSSLEACFTQLSKVTSRYESAAESILNSQNIASYANAFFEELIKSDNELYTFFYYLTQSSDVDSNYYYYNQSGKWTQIGITPDTAIFDNYPKLASGRGFIWARTIPIMFDSVKNFLIGTGPDTFSFHFPHYDYVNLYRCDYTGLTISKPHSMYLQIATQTGVISMLALLALYIIYLVTTIRLLWKSRFTTFTSKVSVAICASVTGYMFSGITNDSTITYSFVFWGLIGIGIAVNRMESKTLQEEKEAEEKERLLAQHRQEREERRKKRKMEQA